jgi:hypothetical protein
LINLNSSKIRVRACWLRINCFFIVALGLILERMNRFLKKWPSRGYRERVAYRRWSERTTNANWSVCEATNSRINCFDMVRIGRAIASQRITSHRIASVLRQVSERLSDRDLVKKLRFRYAMRRTGGETKKRFTILRDRKSEFEKMTVFVIIHSVLQKWIEWPWSTNMIAEILSIDLGLWHRDLLTNSGFRFIAVLPIRYHFGDSVARRSTSPQRITFQNRYFILSSPPPSPIDTDRKPSQKFISLVTSTLLPVVKSWFFEDLS